MKTLRTAHLYLGCLFAPLIIYFCLSGAWQLFRFNDVPKDEPAPVRAVLHALSSPHTNSTAPFRSPKTSHSTLFSVASLFAALGMIATAVLGVLLAFQLPARRRAALLCLLAGLLVPAALVCVVT
jgi:hypothetical protein